MALVVVKGATIKCSHNGVLPLTVGDDRLKVDGNGVVVSGMEVGLQFRTPNEPGQGSPCTAQTQGVFKACLTSAAAAGTSTVLFVDAKPALLDTAQGLTASATGPGTWSVDNPGQSKLESE